LTELVHGELIALLVNSSDPAAQNELVDVQSAAQARGQRILVLNANSESDIDSAFSNLVQQQATALFVGAGSYFSAREISWFN